MVLRFPDLLYYNPFDQLRPAGTTGLLPITPEHAGSTSIKHDPIHGGIYVSSQGDPGFMGTLSGIVTKNGSPYLLSNAHVFYNDCSSTGKAGLKIYQPPAGYSGSRTVGTTLSRHIPPGVRFPKNTTSIPSDQIAKLPTYYDAGIAAVSVKYTFNIPNVGIPTGHTEPKNGMKVTLAGARSGVHDGTITSASTSTIIGGGNCNFISYAKNIFKHSCPSGPGDSGSMIVEKATKKVVGLHFAGSSTNSQDNFGVKASAIVKALGISFAGKSGTFNPGPITVPPVCTPPKILQNGVCVTPPITCTPPRVLRNGVCVLPTPPPPAEDPLLVWVQNHKEYVVAGGCFVLVLVLASASG